MRERRKSLGITQEQLAEKSGLSTNFVARMEIADKTPSISTLLSLADALDTEVSELLESASPHPWECYAQEVARIMESLNEDEASFILSQVQALASFVRSQRKEP